MVYHSHCGLCGARCSLVSRPRVTRRVAARTVGCGHEAPARAALTVWPGVHRAMGDGVGGRRQNVAQERGGGRDGVSLRGGGPLGPGRVGGAAAFTGGEHGGPGGGCAGRPARPSVSGGLAHVAASASEVAPPEGVRVPTHHAHASAAVRGSGSFPLRRLTAEIHGPGCEEPSAVVTAGHRTWRCRTSSDPRGARWPSRREGRGQVRQAAAREPSRRSGRMHAPAANGGLWPGVLGPRARERVAPMTVLGSFAGPAHGLTGLWVWAEQVQWAVVFGAIRGARRVERGGLSASVPLEPTGYPSWLSVPGSTGGETGPPGLRGRLGSSCEYNSHFPRDTGAVINGMCVHLRA